MPNDEVRYTLEDAVRILISQGFDLQPVTDALAGWLTAWFQDDTRAAGTLWLTEKDLGQLRWILLPDPPDSPESYNCDGYGPYAVDAPRVGE